MEERSSKLRAVLPLLKGRVVDSDNTMFKIAIGGSTTITVPMDTSPYDIRDGDLLTLYTEVPFKPPQG